MPKELDMTHLRTRLNQLESSLDEQIKGQKQVIEVILTAFLAQGHLLIEGSPGVGKTSLAKALAAAFQGSFARIQMTSDLLPGELIGWFRPTNEGTNLEFQKGPIFCNFLLADELNRTSPKTQSALLEAMAEKTVSVDGVTYTLPSPFFVIATQNAYESHGVFPLAESQLDRFMLNIPMDIPEKGDEIAIYKQLNGHEITEVKETMSAEFSLEEYASLHQAAINTHIDESLIHYGFEIFNKTRNHSEIHSGISVRGGLQFFDAAKTLSFIRGKDFVSPMEAVDMAIPALAHRIRLHEGDQNSDLKREIIANILDSVPRPK